MFNYQRVPCKKFARKPTTQKMGFQVFPQRQWNHICSLAGEWSESPRLGKSYFYNIPISSNFQCLGTHSWLNPSSCSNMPVPIGWIASVLTGPSDWNQSPMQTEASWRSSHAYGANLWWNRNLFAAKLLGFIDGKGCWDVHFTPKGQNMVYLVCGHPSHIRNPRISKWIDDHI
jgi:hypothetical protein